MGRGEIKGRRPGAWAASTPDQGQRPERRIKKGFECQAEELASTLQAMGTYRGLQSSSTETPCE